MAISGEFSCSFHFQREKSLQDLFAVCFVLGLDTRFLVALQDLV